MEIEELEELNSLLRLRYEAGNSISDLDEFDGRIFVLIQIAKDYHMIDWWIKNSRGISFNVWR